MKKLRISAVIALALGIGAFGGYQISNENKSDVVKEPQQVLVNEQIQKHEEKEKETIKPPTSRTVDIGNKTPWDVYSVNDMIDKANKEQIFLFSDAETLENDLSKDYKNQKYGVYIDVFVAQLRDYYPDKKPYFDKMIEIRDAIVQQNYDSIPKLIEEARVLRTQ
jgi:hypothetical protein